MLEKIEAIDNALQSRCYLPELALALTIPDICGNIEFKFFMDSDKVGVGKRYRFWFDQYVNVYYADDTGFSDDCKRAKNPYFNGDMCYQLRCALLHSGNSKIKEFGKLEDEECIYTYSFELCVNGCDSYGASWESNIISHSKAVKEMKVSVDVEILCRNLCEAAMRYYEWRGEKYFGEHRIRIIDLERFRLG